MEGLQDEILEFSEISEVSMDESSDTFADAPRRKTTHRSKKEIGQDLAPYVRRIQWFNAMYHKLGDPNVQHVRDDASGTLYTLPDLNRFQREFLKEFQAHLMHTQLEAQKKTKRPRRVNPNARDQFSKPFLADDTLYGFLKDANFGQTGNEIRKDLLSAKTGKGRAVNMHVVREMFSLWIQNNPVLRPDGTVLYPTRQSPVERSKVYPDETFVRYFAPDLDRLIEAKGFKPPLKNVGIRDGESVIPVPYIIYHPTTVASITGKAHRKDLPGEHPKLEAHLNEIWARTKEAKQAKAETQG